MQRKENKEISEAVIKVSRYVVYITFVAVVCMLLAVVCLLNNVNQYAVPTPVNAPRLASNAVTPLSPSVSGTPAAVTLRSIPADAWRAPDENTIPEGNTGAMIRYGKDLLSHTAKYFGPKGIIEQVSNGMNCQNCHLAGGTRLFGNNYASFIASYPKLSGRSGKVEPASERISECFERSLAGRVPDTTGKEVRAILAYMKWVGQDVKKGQKLFGNATEKLPLMAFAADPVKGKAIFMLKCRSCHGNNGEGLFAADKRTYIYPPLWGKHSYNDGAGMYRIMNFAGFVKNNMPFGATYQNPQLTDEEAWNVAAFVNSQPRPHRDQHNDWKDLRKKPIDYPFGPYTDAFSEKQHKYGPFKLIKDAQRESAEKKS
jgi:thiosulfate dehydrogenase